MNINKYQIFDIFYNKINNWNDQEIKQKLQNR